MRESKPYSAGLNNIIIIGAMMIEMPLMATLPAAYTKKCEITVNGNRSFTAKRISCNGDILPSPILAYFE
jgi:hypothetical protein